MTSTHIAVPITKSHNTILIDYGEGLPKQQFETVALYNNPSLEDLNKFARAVWGNKICFNDHGPTGLVMQIEVSAPAVKYYQLGPHFLEQPAEAIIRAIGTFVERAKCA